jgi:hypothetical protein
VGASHEHALGRRSDLVASSVIVAKRVALRLECLPLGMEREEREHSVHTHTHIRPGQRGSGDAPQDRALDLRPAGPASVCVAEISNAHQLQVYPRFVSKKHTGP